MAKKKSVANRNRKIIKWIWRGLFIFFAAVFLIFFLIYNGIIGYMPPVAELRNPTDRFASTMYTADGQEMGRIFRNKGNRLFAEFNQMSPFLKQALVATEDSRFEDHSGIDAKALMRSVIKRIIMGQKEAGGGSTITQQLAKQLYSESTNNIFERALQKPIEWMIAIKLERYYTKEEIMQMYFNQFDFLNNAVGIKTAAYVYFGKNSAADLNLQESALLVGMCKNPSYYNPKRYPERAKGRRNLVLNKMVEEGFISQAQCDEAKASDIKLTFHKVSHSDGVAPYAREEIRRMMTAKEPKWEDYPRWNKNAFYDDSAQWVNNPLYGWCNKNHKGDGTPYDIYSDGLKIYTTIDSKMQDYAEKAVLKHLRNLQPSFASECGGYRDPYTNNRAELSAALKEKLIRNAIFGSNRARALKAKGMSDSEILNNFNTKTHMTVFSKNFDGEVEVEMTPKDSIMYTKTLLRCGMMSMDPKTGYVKAYVGGPDYKHFNYDMVSVGRRQIGSTMKPYLYSLAMESGYTPCDRISNARIVIDGWSPRGGGGGGMLTLKQGLTSSNNTMSARLIDALKPTNLITMLHNFGLTNRFDTVAPLCLGPCEISVKQMVSGYSTFANNGMRSDPVFVTKICDNHGNVLAEFSPRQSEVISPLSCFKMLDLLKSVVNAGTGRRIRGSYNIHAELGGKTGTTNRNSDGWFMGVAPDLVTGVWVGGEERYIHFKSGGIGQGAGQALPIFAYFMRSLYDDPSLPYSQETKFDKMPDDMDLCYREKGVNLNNDIGGGQRKSNGNGQHKQQGNGQQGGGDAANKEESHQTHQADVVQGVFD